MKVLSIAIPSWNTTELLDQCLDSVYKSSAGLDLETIVVDNASSDGSADMVADKYPQVILIRNNINVGFAGACNLAFKHSTGRYLLLLNSDTIVLDDALRAMVDFMDSHSDAGAAGCKLINRDRSLQRSCSRFPDLLTELFDALYLSKLFPKSKIFGCYAMTYWDFDEVQEVDFVGGSCLILRREVIEEVGLLDEGFFMYAEEADLCYRLWQHDWAVYFYPGAQVIHLGGESSKKYGSDILLNLYLSRNRFIRKHQGKTAASVHRFIVGFGALGRLGVFSLRRTADSARAIDFQTKLLKWAVQGQPNQISPGSEGES